VVVLAVCWTGYRFNALRTATGDILAETQRSQRAAAALAGEVEAYGRGFLARTGDAFGGSFVEGREWYSDVSHGQLEWNDPSDGVYLVVDWDCPWSRGAIDLALGVAEQGRREVILLDSRPENASRWRNEYAGLAMLRVIQPTGGWWSVGAPNGVTPVWFAVAGGRFADVGVGADDLEEFAFDPAAPVVYSFSQNDLPRPKLPTFSKE